MTLRQEPPVFPSSDQIMQSLIEWMHITVVDRCTAAHSHIWMSRPPEIGKHRTHVRSAIPSGPGPSNLRDPYTAVRAAKIIRQSKSILSLASINRHLLQIDRTEDPRSVLGYVFHHSRHILVGHFPQDLYLFLSLFFFLILFSFLFIVS